MTASMQCHPIHFECIFSRPNSLSLPLSLDSILLGCCFALHCVPCYQLPFGDSQHIHICQTCWLARSLMPVYNSNGAKCELNRDLNHCLYANMNLNCANYIVHWFSFQTTIEHYNARLQNYEQCVEKNNTALKYSISWYERKKNSNYKWDSTRLIADKKCISM